MKSNTPFGKRGSVVVVTMALLYLLFSVGIIKATHFCMGREASVAYFTAESEKCPCSLFAGKEDPCCEDSHDLVKLEDSQKSFTVFKLPVPVLTLLGGLHPDAAPVAPDESSQLLPPDGSDALPPPQHLFKLHCSFVFYDGMTVA